MAYTVVLVSGREPEGLEDFVDAGDLVVAVADQTLRLTGSGALNDDRVTFTQKDAGAGKDVRVWSILATDDGFSAIPLGLIR